MELSAQVYRGFGAAGKISGTNVGDAADSGVGLSIAVCAFQADWLRTYFPTAPPTSKTPSASAQASSFASHNMPSNFDKF